MMPEPPSTAPANPLGALETLEEIRSLRAENVDLKRELLDKIRGNSKFVSGGQFRGGLKAECKNCAVSARTAQDAVRQLQSEQAQRQQMQQLYEEECRTSTTLLSALGQAEARIEELESNLKDPVEKERPQSPEELTRLRKQFETLQEQSSDLARELMERKLRATQLASEQEALLAEKAMEAEYSLKKQQQAHSIMEQAHWNALEAMRSKVGLLETQLSKKSEELDALRKGQENESQIIKELREAMQKAKQESDVMLKDAYANIEAFAAERDELTLNVTHLDRERGRLVEECAELDSKLLAANRKAAQVDTLEEQIAKAALRLTQRDADVAAERKAYEDSERRLAALQEKMESVSSELRNLTVEKAAISAQLQSMVQLVVVAPSVNVGLGNGDTQVCAPDLASVEAEVASVINRDVIPSFLKVFVKQLGSSSTPKEPAVPAGYVDQLVADMQATIGEHLRPVLIAAWNKNGEKQRVGTAEPAVRKRISTTSAAGTLSAVNSAVHKFKKHDTRSSTDGVVFRIDSRISGC